RLTGTLSDITELKKAENKLKMKNEQLTRVNNDLDNFIYTASHDLKAPISNLEGLLNAFVSDSQFDPEQLSLVEMMFNSIERFKTTIKDLTDITKLQRADLDNNEILSFHGLLEEVKLDIRELIENLNATIHQSFEIPEISYSRKNLRSIIYNLLSNALKYSSPERRPEIKISSKREHDFIIFEILDNGLGLSKENQSKIFGMFKRAHQHIEGSGIGLYIIKKMVENAGGKIEVESEVGMGTTFKVYLKVE
ncbi:MAG TPA: HAMP domain-containing sensor histidine kinase, partial [Cytophagaceae bacterium]